MLTSTFLHLPRAGPTMEKAIWSQDIDSWWDFLNTKNIKGIAPQRKIAYDLALRRAEKALDSQDTEYFVHTLPHHSMWRLWATFQEDAVFLDIETNGYRNDITVIGLYSQDGVQTFVAGKNMEKESFLAAMSRHKLVVTFNGACFDLPVISRYFGIQFHRPGYAHPKTRPQERLSDEGGLSAHVGTTRKNTLIIPHIDLRGVCSQIGLKGGLKAIEKTIGLKRPEEVDGMDGYMAVILWDQFRRTGDQKYLERLVEYNTQDIVNLKPLADYAIPKLWKQIRCVKPPSSFTQRI